MYKNIYVRLTNAIDALFDEIVLVFTFSKSFSSGFPEINLLTVQYFVSVMTLGYMIFKARILSALFIIVGATRNIAVVVNPIMKVKLSNLSNSCQSSLICFTHALTIFNKYYQKASPISEQCEATLKRDCKIQQDIAFYRGLRRHICYAL